MLLSSGDALADSLGSSLETSSSAARVEKLGLLRDRDSEALSVRPSVMDYRASAPGCRSLSLPSYSNDTIEKRTNRRHKDDEMVLRPG